LKISEPNNLPRRKSPEMSPESDSGPGSSVEDEVETGVVCNVGLFNNPLCFIGTELSEQELLQGLLLTGKMTDAQFRKLVAINVAQYLKMLNLAPEERRNSDMLAAWLYAACNTWILVAGDNGIASVKIGEILGVVNMIGDF
jgi:hypothetical protein